MDNAAPPPGSSEISGSLTKWVDEMLNVIKAITTLGEESARHRALAESAQREYANLCEEVAKLRTEVERIGMLASAAERQRDEAREEVIMVRAENHRLRMERAEAGEAAAKLLGEVKDLVNEVAHKIQGPPSASPFDHEARTPRS
jgi:chromosome segregation ATPase